MAMRHLWCACTKFQPNPASRRVLSRSQSGNGSRKTTRIIPSVSNNQILKAMRKSFVYAAGLMCLALSITDCQKELVDQTTPASEPNFELFAQPVTTKTSNDGLDTRWVAKDAINVFHAEAGSTAYDSDGRFTVKDIETGRFDGTVSKSLSADKSYDWYAFYPYSSYNKTPAGISKDTFGYTTIGGTSQTQTDNGSRAHLAGESCPLYGIASNVASDKVPSISMNHLTSVIKVSVTNNSGEDLTVSSVSFTGTEDIVGTYYINFAASPVAYKSSGNAYVSSTASLTVSNGEALANGSSADFYIALKPFTAKTGSTLKLAVNGYEKTLTLKNDITFTAGHIKPLNFNFDKKVLDSVTLPWSIDGTGGSSVWKNTVGLSQNGINTKDYASSNSPYLTKIDNTNDYVQIKIDSPASFVKFGVKGFSGGSGSTESSMTVQGSISGDTFTDIEKFTISSAKILSFTTSATINPEYRYIRLLFTKGSYNVGLGAVEISKHSTDPVISADNVLGVSARGVVNQELAYTITNTVEGAVLSVAGDNTVVEAIEMDGTITYDVKKNTSKESREGSITLTYSKGGETLAEKTVKVQQNAPVFNAARTTVELGATVDASTTITLTSDFDWMAEASAGATFTFTPDTYTWAEGGKQTVTIKATAANESENGTIERGTITFTNVETKETLEVKVTQKSSYVAPTIGKKVEFVYSNLYSDIKSGSTSLDNKTDVVDGVSIKYVKLSGNNAPQYYFNGTNLRIYNKSTMTITAPVGKVVTSIDFSQGTTTWVSEKMSSDSGTIDEDNKKWTKSSNVNNVILTITGSFRFTKIVVTYE